jgi:cell division protein FtsZ
LLDDVSLQGAKGVLISITGGYDMTLYEVDEAANRIREEVDANANIIFGSTFDERLNGRLRVSVVATGIGADLGMRPQRFAESPDVLSFGKRDTKPKVFEETMMKQHASPIQESEKQPENKGSEVLYNPEKIEEEDNRNRKRAASFFGKFASKNRQDRQKEGTYPQERRYPRENVEDDKLEDDLDIPSCFRRKKNQ